MLGVGKDSPELGVLENMEARAKVLWGKVPSVWFSVAYVELWRRLLERHESLHMFCYTARTDDAIADALRSLARDAGWSRFDMRVSNGPFPLRSTVTIESVRQKPVGAVVCPEQIGRTESCSTCGLCWQTERRIAFVQY